MPSQVTLPRPILPPAPPLPRGDKPESPKTDPITQAREELAAGIKKRLAAPHISVFEARDGIRDCFVSSYLGGMSMGLAGFDIHGRVADVAAVADSIMRQRLKKHGSSWESPTTVALERVREEADRELRMDQLPAELKEVHDKVCNLLIAKASGLMEHRGNRSVVTQQQPNKNTNTDRFKTRPEPDPVVAGLRSSLVAFLDAMCKAASDGEAPDQLMGRLGKLSKLIETMQVLSEDQG